MYATIDKVVECIDSRFISFSEDEVLLGFDIFDPANWPPSKESLASYGLRQLHFLAKHFTPLLESQGCQLDMLDREWLAVKLDVHRHYSDLTMQDLWKKLLTTPEKARNYQNILHLIHIMFVVPAVTAHVECHFSFTKRFLGDWRLGLLPSTIEALLRISVEDHHVLNLTQPEALRSGTGKLDVVQTSINHITRHYATNSRFNSFSEDEVHLILETGPHQKRV